MTTPNSIEENLSEEILSENVSTGQVKINKRLCQNMTMSSFHKKELLQTENPRERMVSLPNSMMKRVYTCQEEEKWANPKANSCVIDRRLVSLHLGEDGRKEDSKLQQLPLKGSLKDEISSLLKKSIQIRQKSSFIKKKKDEDTPLEEVGFTHRRANPGEFYTFGVKN